MTLYQKLRASGNPQAPIQTIISLLESGHPVKEVARTIGVSKRWVYEIRRRYRDSGGDISKCMKRKGPKRPMPNRTPKHIEELVVQIARETNAGPKRIAIVLDDSWGIKLSPYTIRNVLRRYGIRCRKVRTSNGQRRYATDLAAFSPLQFFQIDVKHIADQSALPSDAYASIFRNKLPQYQFTAIDVRTRMRFLAYADELSFKNGLTFMLLVANWLRTFGVRTKVFFQTDNGTEFGGLGASRKRQLMQQLIFDSLDVQLLSTPPRALLNSFVERSHRTDDEEFYAINLTSATSRSAFMKMAQAWSLYFNYRRPHFGKNMKGKTPVMALKKFHSMSSVAIGAMPVLNLDRLSLHLAELCDITTIPWNNSPKTQRAVKETMAPYHLADRLCQEFVGKSPDPRMAVKDDYQMLQS